MDELKGVIAELKNELHEMRREVAALRVEIEKGKTGVTMLRVLGVMVMGVFGYFVQAQINNYENWNNKQDAQLIQLMNDTHLLKEELLKIQYAKSETTRRTTQD